MADKTLKGLIFSRDRALQLDGLLRSFLLHCQDAKQIHLFVLYKATSDLHARQYKQLERDYSTVLQVQFLPENDFRSDVLNLLTPQFSSMKIGRIYRWLVKCGYHFGSLSTNFIKEKDLSKEFIFFMVDDSIFVQPFSLSEVYQELALHPEAVGFSLRLGGNTTYCYSLNAPQDLPKFETVKDRFVKFDWTKAEKDFGYPLEISSSVFRLGDVFPLMHHHSFHHPNELESMLAGTARNFRDVKPYLLCFRESVAFANPVNKVQTVYQNRAGVIHAYDSEQLARMFADGYRLKVDAYAGIKPNACHMEVEMIFEKLKVSSK